MAYFPDENTCPALMRDGRKECLQGRSQGRVPAVPEPPPPPHASRNPPLLFLTAILSQQECNGLSIPVILRFVLCLQ